MSDFLKADQLIGSRYRLSAKDIDQLPYSGVSVWRAVDTTLKNAVRILVLDPKSPNFAEVLDAARRASLFDDAHAVKILRVDSDSEYGWIVTEIPLGVPLSYRLHSEAFPPEQAKALVGETARVIAAASAQGIRHLDIKPADVRVDSQGQVFLDGLAVHAALAGIRADTDMPYELDRKEASSLTRLYGRLLSGDNDGDIGVVLQNLSQDESLDSSLRYFFEKSLRGAGALSPSDLIRNLGSWGTVSVADLPAIPGTHTGELADEDMDTELGIPHEPTISAVPQWPSARPVADEVTAEENLGDEEERGDEVAEDSATSDDNAASEDNLSEQGDETAQQTVNDQQNTTPAPEETVTKSENAGEKESVTVTPDKNGDDGEKKNFLSSIATKTSQKSKKLSGKTVSGITSVAGSKAVRDAMSSLERQMDKVSDVPEGGGARRYDTSWLFTAITIGLVVIAGVWASLLFFNVPKVETVEQGPTGPAIINDDDAPTTQDDDTEGNPLVESVELINPQAGNVPTSEGVAQDNPDTVGNIADAKTSTVWESWWYPTSHYTTGKDGLGLRIKLKEPLAINNMSVQVNGTGGNIQWLAGEPGTNPQVLAESPMSTATHLIPEQTVTSDTVILWITELPIDKVKQNRAVIAEVDFNRQISDAVRDSAQSD
ncbi:MAG: hypothetical protein IKS49_07445 [Actinomycetaceae bacterium]|nr:hypothetical protein [Actinomycetaceae bacterium]